MRNREKAYMGSYMQFIRALWSKKLDQYGYNIYKGFNRNLTADSILLDSAQQKFIKFKGRVTVVHSYNRSLATFISVTNKAVSINQDGFYNVHLHWSGYMTTQRIGDMLPYEYRSAKELKDAGISTNIIDEDPVRSDRVAAVLKPVKVPLGKSAKLFKTIVLVPNNKLDTRLVVKKWHYPVGYKIYGTTNNLANDKSIVRYANRMFARIAQLTGLNIYNAANGNEGVNFTIILGDVNQSQAAGIPDEALPYLREKDGVGLYYETTEQGFTKLIAQIATTKDTQAGAVEAYVRTLLLRALGFLNSTGNKQSIFYSDVNFWNPDKEINPADAAMIKTLYQPEIRSGMTEQELDQILKDVKL